MSSWASQSTEREKNDNLNLILEEIIVVTAGSTELASWLENYLSALIHNVRVLSVSTVRWIHKRRSLSGGLWNLYEYCVLIWENIEKSEYYPHVFLIEVINFKSLVSWYMSASKSCQGYFRDLHTECFILSQTKEENGRPCIVNLSVL